MSPSILFWTGPRWPDVRGFPLLVASHGNLVSSAKNMPDTLEALASYGYVVASVEHTGNDDAYYQTSVLESWAGGLELGPNPSHQFSRHHPPAHQRRQFRDRFGPQGRP